MSGQAFWPPWLLAHRRDGRWAGGEGCANPAGRATPSCDSAQLAPSILSIFARRIQSCLRVQVSCLGFALPSPAAPIPPSPRKQHVSLLHAFPYRRAVASHRPGRLKAEGQEGQGGMNDACELLLPWCRRGRPLVVGWSHRYIPRGACEQQQYHSKAGEATRCRRARTSCQRRTCGHLRFMIGQCAAGQSPTCTPRMRQGGQLTPGSLCRRWAGGGCQPAGWCRDSLLKRLCGAGLGSRGYVPFSCCQDSCQAPRGGTHCDHLTLWCVAVASNRMSPSIRSAKPSVYEKDQSPAGQGGPQDGAWLRLKLWYAGSRPTDDSTHVQTRGCSWCPFETQGWPSLETTRRP